MAEDTWCSFDSTGVASSAFADGCDVVTCWLASLSCGMSELKDLYISEMHLAARSESSPVLIRGIKTSKVKWKARGFETAGWFAAGMEAQEMRYRAKVMSSSLLTKFLSAFKALTRTRRSAILAEVRERSSDFVEV